MHRLALILALAPLTACGFATQTADELARQQAKAVINGVVASRFPGMNVTPVTECVIDNASANEIITMAGAAVTGVTATTVTQVVEIAQRPETVSCIASNGLGLLTI